MSKKKNLLKKAKEQLKTRREELIDELQDLYNLREKTENLENTNSEIDRIIKEISIIDLDLSRKDKKSSNIQWSDPDYKASVRGNGARKAHVVNVKEYDKLQDKKFSFDSGPQPLWLKPGILVKTKGRLIPGIVVETRSNYATVLFGGTEVHIRMLALRPADWEN